MYMGTSKVTTPSLSYRGKGVACHYEKGQKIPCQTGSTRFLCEVWFTSKFMCCQDFPKHRPYTTSLKVCLRDDERMWLEAPVLALLMRHLNVSAQVYTVNLGYV